MRCPHCQNDAPDAAAFCMKCGAALPRIQRMAPGAAAPQAPQAPQVSGPTGIAIPRSQGKPWLWVASVVALLVIGVIALGASGVLFARGQKPEPGVLRTQKDPEPPGILQARPAPSAGVTAQQPPPPEAQVNMPADVRAWLEHLERTERERSRLANQHIGEFTVALTQLQMAGVQDLLNDIMADPTSEDTLKSPAKEQVQDFDKARAEWRALTDGFLNVVPPAECVPIRNRYEIALRETSAAIYDLIEILEMSQQPDADPKQLVGKLQGMRGASGHIDAAGKETDALVQDICDKYKTRKWFSIAGDIGSGGLLGKFGGGL